MDRPEFEPTIPRTDEPPVEGTAVYRENLIYLPFAAHLAEEDAETWAKAA